MNPAKEFFDKLAPSWDSRQTKEEGEILPLLKKIGIKGGDRVLDLACGTGTITSLLHSLGASEVLGLDISDEMIKVAKEKLGSMPWVSFRVGDFLESDFHEEFDVIVLYNAYPHFLEPEKLAKRFYASLKKGGKFAIVHSLGRKELDTHHAAIASKVSRSLDPVEEEAKRFDSFFHIEEAVEGEHFFFLAGSKI